MEKYVIFFWVCLVASLVLAKLVWNVVKMWRKAKKEQADMKRPKAGSVWRQRPRTVLNDPFVEDDRFRVTVQETRVNSDGRMWVKYLHKSGLEDTAPADVFVQMYIYVEGPIYAVKGVAAVEEEDARGLERMQTNKQANERDMIDYGLAKRRAMIAATGEALKLTADVPYVSGEMIYLGISNYLRRSGRGEMVTTR